MAPKYVTKLSFYMNKSIKFPGDNLVKSHNLSYRGSRPTSSLIFTIDTDSSALSETQTKSGVASNKTHNI